MATTAPTTATTSKLIAYYRVSTKAQGSSGLGLEGQVAAVAVYAGGSGAEIIRSYQEIESGKRSDRPELLRALADARRSRATLVIAKLDRLSRNLAFLANLMEAKVPFVACDNPHATPFTVHILAAVAEHEAKMISDRTKTALAAYKARGGILGARRDDCQQLSDEARAKGRGAAGKKIQANTNAAYSDLLPLIQCLRSAGNTLQQIADKLNADGHVTRKGRPWGPMQVSRVLDRSAA